MTAATVPRPALLGGRERLLARGLPGGVFAVLLYVEIHRLGTQLHAHHGLIRPVGQGLYLLFIALFMVLTVLRPPAQAIDRRPLPWLATVVGTFGLVVSPLFLTASGGHLFWLGRVGAELQAILSLASIVGSLIALASLGTAFSLIPQAHRLVVRGPYRLVRHPMYLFEGLAMVGGVLAAGTVMAVVTTAAVIAAQLGRIHFEEILLRSVFPEYEERFAGVAHLVPGIY